MKPLTHLSILVLLSLSLFGCEDKPQKDNTDVYSEIADPVFLEYVRSLDLDTDGDGRLSKQEAGMLEELALSYLDDGNLKISSLKGIEFFTGLKKFKCEFTDIYDFSIAGFGQLRELEVSHNGNLESINIKRCPALTDFTFTGKDYNYKFPQGVQKVDINISECGSLASLKYYGIDFDKLDLSPFLQLREFESEWSAIDEIDISLNYNLIKFDIASMWTHPIYDRDKKTEVYVWWDPEKQEPPFSPSCWKVFPQNTELKLKGEAKDIFVPFFAVEVDVTELPYDYPWPVFMSVKSNTDWTLESYPSWCTVSRSQGNRDAQVEVRPSLNVGEQREGVIVFECDGKEYPVAIEQAAFVPSLQITPKQYTQSHAAGTVYFTVLCNCEWSVSYDEPWISVDPVSGKGDKTVIVEVRENTVPFTERGAGITVSARSLSETFVLEQEAFEPYLRAEFTIETISYEANAVALAVYSNSNYKWSVSCNSTWLSVSPASGKGNGIVIVTVEENKPAGEDRTAVITVLTEDGMHVTCYLTQQPKP